jgi:hypothetical protein
MRRFFSIFTTAVFCFSVFASAQQDTTASNDSTQSNKCSMMAGAMMGGMMPRVVANLQDGSILVLSGHQLYKYSKDLKLVNQVTIPRDTATMQSMQKMCPGMKMQGRGKSPQ